jgi:glycosyltransferase involved in cell wall biosynthesis
MSIAPDSVWLDARGTQSAAHSERGIPRYVAEHSKALLRMAPELVGSVALSPAVPFPGSMEPLMGSGRLTWHSKMGPGGRPVPGIYHVMSPLEVTIPYDDIWPAWVRESGCRLVVTLYDLIPVIYRDEYLDVWGDFATAWTSRLGLMRAAHQVVTISRQTAADAIEHLGLPEERVTAIESGVSGHFAALVGSPSEAEAILSEALPDVRRGFILYTAGNDYRKNLDGTIAAYGRLPRELRANHQLVLVGNLSRLRRSELRASARDLGVRGEDVLLTGFIPDRVLAALYRSCNLFLFSSLYEGAGLPILEAMSCGAPVVTSNVSSMPELLGDSEGTFDPTDPDDIASCLRDVLTTPGVLDRLRERSRRRAEFHTWDRVAGLTVEGYERAMAVPASASAGRPSRPRRRKRLAVVTPWPPQESEAARHSRRLVEELSAHADVEVIVSGNEDVEWDRSLEGVSIRSAAQFEWLRDLEGYDRCLYVIGGDLAHMHALEGLTRVPGFALVHDVRLLGLYSDLHRHRHPYDPYWLEGKLIEMYGDRMPAMELHRIPYDDPHANQQLPMTREVQAHAHQVLIHSRHQAEVLRLERPQGGAPAEIVPHGLPAPPSANGHGDRAGLRVVAMGDASLRPRVVEAFGELASGRPGARLTIVGRASRAEGESLMATAARLGAAVELVGPVAERERWEVLRTAAVAIQLERDPDGGRASASVCEAIAARVPTIVSGAGWRAELPDDVVIAVPVDCSASALAAEISSVLDDRSRGQRIRGAQDAYAEENSFSRVAERYAELLSLG